MKGLTPGEHLMASKERFHIAEYFNEYIKWGGFPEVAAARNTFEKQKIVKEYLDAIFFKDLVERYEISNLFLLKALKNKRKPGTVRINV